MYSSSNQDQVYFVKILEYVGFSVHDGSCLLWPLVIESWGHSSRAKLCQHQQKQKQTNYDVISVASRRVVGLLRFYVNIILVGRYVFAHRSAILRRGGCTYDIRTPMCHALLTYSVRASNQFVRYLVPAHSSGTSKTYACLSVRGV